jgi:hypothetical protein
MLIMIKSTVKLYQLFLHVFFLFFEDQSLGRKLISLDDRQKFPSNPNHLK